MLVTLWIVVGVGVALWSLLGWGAYELLSTDPAWLGDVRLLLDRVPFADLLAHWVPGWRALAEFVLDALQWALGGLNAAAPVVAWAVWGVGTLVLVGAGALLSLLVALLRDKPAPARPS